MPALFIHQDAATDLQGLRATEPVAAARILALLGEIEGDPDLLDHLTQHDYGSHRSASFHVSKWQEQWRKGLDLWRLKAWDLEGQGIRYRIVYAFIPEKLHYHVLGIADREFNYDSNHPTSRRILKAYQDLCQDY